jgi:2-C-methyl-D-erythritol 2,4-cyclodiphosphate synthase
MSMRVGIGWDSHAFKPGVPLRIGGLSINHPEGLAGHSDGDVLLHAITDALLGAVSAGDIGSFFPPNDPRWKDADSSIFLNLAIEEIQNAGYHIVNVDTTLVLSAPKIAPIANEMRERIADMLDVEPDAVGIKAKTPEGLNLDHVVQAHVVVLLEKSDPGGDLKTLAAEIDDPAAVEQVVKSLVGDVGLSTERRKIIPSFDTEDIT